MNLDNPKIWTVTFIGLAGHRTTWYECTSELLTLPNAETLLTRMSERRKAYITDVRSATDAYRAAGAFHDEARLAALKHSHWDTAAATGDYYAAVGTPSNWDAWATDRNI